jgi:transcriptional pleiotropic regulator of transition state genes
LRREEIMKATGIVRKVDELGRVVIPVDIRRTMDIEIKDGIEIFVDNDRIILMKYKPSYECVFCGSTENVGEFKGKTYL